MKKIYFFTLVLLYLSFLVPSVYATALSVAAANCPVGQFCQVPGMVNLNLTASVGFDNAINTGGPGYDGSQAGWDSATRKLYIETAEHGRGTLCPESWPNSPNVCWKKLWTYDDTTSTWTVNGPFPHYTNGDPVGTYHVFGKNAWDNVNKALYVKDHNFTVTLFRYCATNSPAAYCASQLGQWLQISQFSPPSGTIFGQMGWFPFLNGGELLYWDAEGGGCGSLRSYKEGVGWATIDPGTSPTCKYPYGATTNGPMILSTIKQVMIYGPSGATTKQWWRIDAKGAIAALDPAPCNYFQTDGGFFQASEDPNTGNIYFFGCDGSAAGKLYKLDPTASTGNQWTLIDNDLSGAGKICAIARQGKCGFDFYASPISNYGVIGFWKYRDNATAEYWIYKASATGGDTTPPTVSVTAPTGGATVSGSVVTISATAADNQGVVGVQFKIDGAATGTEDATAPYSITWNSTTVSNGTHLITATARDAAGNNTTSSSVSVTVSNGGANFATRCAAAGVIRCQGFDLASSIANTIYGGNSGIDTNGTSIPVLDSTVKASGASSLKMTIPANSTANSSGDYWLNFSDDLLTQFGAGTAFYVQWRQRFSSCMLFQGSAEPCTGPARAYAGAAGWKQVHIGTGDKPGCTTSNNSSGLCYSSCSDLETVPTNTLHRGFPQMYQGCPGNNVDLFEPFSSIYSSNDFKLQNARPTPFCLYQAGVINPANYYAPNGNCIPYVADEWMTFKIKITVGNRNGSRFDNSRIEMWVAREGQPSVQVLNFPYSIYAGAAVDDQKFGKVWFDIYNTGKSGAETNPVAYSWYDELIVSTQDIADPNAAPDTTNPTAAITSPIPPTTSTIASPIAVSGTATDDVAVTSVTWTCIQCVTKGGTATSSPGTSISWTIPTLDLVAGTNTLNVVAHDAAGNVSTAATLAITYTPNTTYWVRPTGTMSGCTASGTAPTTDAGYKSTITAGVNCMAAGNRLVIRAGTYNERLDEEAGGITYPRATSWGGASIIEALAGEIVTVLPQTANGNAVIRTASTATNYYLWFQGHNRNFVIDGTNVTTGMSVIKIQSPFVRLDSMEIKNGRTANGGNGVMVVEPSLGAEILNSNIHNNGIVGDVNAQSYGIYYQTQNGIITGNDIHDNTGYGIQIYRSGGTPPASNTFANNRVYNNGCTTNIGAVTVMGQNHKVYNNIIYNNCGRNLEAYYYTDNAGTVFYNNTLYGNTNADFALFLNNGVTAKNNISSNNAGALVAGPTNGGTDSNGSGTTTVADHNLCSSACGFGSSNVTDTAANTFVNAAAGNFHLGPNAFAKDQGVSTLGSPYNVDFDGLPRTSPWDIGAYEFVASGPSPVVTIVNPTSNPTLSVTQPLFSLGGTSNLP